MEYKNVSEKESILIANELLEYLSTIDNGSINHILTSKDEDSKRNNVGWYQHIDNNHIININIPNILCFSNLVHKS